MQIETKIQVFSIFHVDNVKNNFKVLKAMSFTYESMIL